MAIVRWDPFVSSAAPGCRRSIYSTGEHELCSGRDPGMSRTISISPSRTSPSRPGREEVGADD